MAGRACTVCQHPAREDIDRALVAGAPLRRLSAEFGLSLQALHRHKSGHLVAALVAAQKAQEVARADDLLSQVRYLQERALEILDRAEAARDYKTALQSIREARGCIELLAELTHQLERRPEINILMSPEWWRIRTAMLEALEPYPEARIAVAQRLWELGDGNGAG